MHCRFLCQNRDIPLGNRSLKRVHSAVRISRPLRLLHKLRGPSLFSPLCLECSKDTRSPPCSAACPFNNCAPLIGNRERKNRECCIRLIFVCALIDPSTHGPHPNHREGRRWRAVARAFLPVPRPDASQDIARRQECGCHIDGHVSATQTKKGLEYPNGYL